MAIFGTQWFVALGVPSALSLTWGCRDPAPSLDEEQGFGVADRFPQVRPDRTQGLVLQGPGPGLIKDRSPDRDRTPLGPDRDRSHQSSPAVPVRSSHRQQPVEDRSGLVRTGPGLL